MLSEIAEKLMRCPAAPRHELSVRSAAEAICREHGIECRRDAFGNLLARWQNASGQRPLVLAAHLDHPGFSVIRRLGPRRLLAEFLGGVPDEYFRPGTRVLLMPEGQPARLGRRVGREKRFEITTAKPLVGLAKFAVWDLPAFALRGARIEGRSCDDLIGAASALATLIELKRRRARVNVIALLARAEEIGFQGALAAADAKEIPRNSLVVSLETSRELPPVKMGQGVIVRVGDRTSVFDSAATRFLTEVAARAQKREQAFRFQRALMSGGTCEGTAYQEFGYQTAALCVALGNYHNCANGRQIAAEFVDLGDVQGMVRLLVEAAHALPNYPKLVADLPNRLRKLLRSAKATLPRTALDDVLE